MEEIRKLSLTAQSKVLNVIQNIEISRLGANYKVPIDIRLICATNKDLNQMVLNGEFREDLLYRINTIQIDVPALKERIGDIELLINHFTKLYASKYDKKIIKIDPVALNNLEKYNWPGNVRELQHIVEKAVILCETDVLKDSDFWFGEIVTKTEIDTLDLSENEKRII